MILGKLKDLAKYRGISKNLDTAIEFILNNDLKNLAPGRNEVDSDNVFINRFSYNTIEESECFFEGHKKYIDIHIVLEGNEYLGYSDISELEAATEYDEESDFIKYEGKVSSYLKLNSETFCVTFPEDIHMPKIKVDEKLVEKVVCKVLVSN